MITMIIVLGFVILLILITIYAAIKISGQISDNEKGE